MFQLQTRDTYCICKLTTEHSGHGCRLILLKVGGKKKTSTMLRVKMGEQRSSSPVECLPTFKSFIKLLKPELILASPCNKNLDSTIKKRKEEEEGGEKRERSKADRSIFIFRCRRYHLKGFLITTARQKLLGFLPDAQNDKVSSLSLPGA